MEDLENFEFRLLVAGRYRYPSLKEDALAFEDGHYSLGPVFTVKSFDETFFGLQTEGKWVISEGKGLRAVAACSGTRGFVVLEPHVVHPRELYALRWNGLYLDGEWQWQPEKASSARLQLLHRDDCNPDLHSFDRPPSPCFMETPWISADGVYLLDSNKEFCLHLVGEGNMADARVFEEEGNLLTFGSEISMVGIGFQFEVCGSGVGLRGEDGYLGVRPDDVDDLRFFSEPPERPVQLLPATLPSTFALWDGIAFYRIEFYKASYGAPQRVDTLEEASLVQFVCRSTLS